jgi:hypothetical protein
MTSKEYILNNIPALMETFPMIQCRYEYKSYSDMHLIEVSPESIIEDTRFAEESEKFVDNFLDKFPFESIAFLGSSSIAKVTAPTEIFAGPLFIDVEVAVALEESALESYKTRDNNVIQSPYFVTETPWDSEDSSAGKATYAMAA